MSSLALATEYYIPNYNDDGCAVDIYYTHGRFEKQFPNGVICNCTNRKFENVVSFRSHQKSEKHQNYIENLKQSKSIVEDNSEIKKQLKEARDKYNIKYKQLQEEKEKFDKINIEKDLNFKKELKKLEIKCESLDDSNLLLQVENDELKDTLKTLEKKIEKYRQNKIKNQ